MTQESWTLKLNFLWEISLSKWLRRDSYRRVPGLGHLRLGLFNGTPEQIKECDGNAKDHPCVRQPKKQWAQGIPRGMKRHAPGPAVFLLGRLAGEVKGASNLLTLVK